MHFLKEARSAWAAWIATMHAQWAETHLRHGSYAAAAAAATHALRWQPAAPDLLLMRARALHCLGSRDAALRDLDAALALDRRCAAAYAHRALLNWERGAREDAMGDANLALYYNPHIRIAALVRAQLDEAAAVRTGS